MANRTTWALLLFFLPAIPVSCALNLTGEWSSPPPDVRVDLEDTNEQPAELDADGADIFAEDGSPPADQVDQPGDGKADAAEDASEEELHREGWLGDWARRVKVTIDGGDIDASLADFPVLVHLSDSSGLRGDNLSFVFDELTDDAHRRKIAVTQGDGETQCFVEIDEWRFSERQAWLWVRVPAIPDADTDLYLYYDVRKEDNGTYVGLTGSVPGETVWDAGFRMVQHMKDSSSVSIQDSSSSSNDGGKKAENEPGQAAGKIASAQSFDGNDFITVLDSASLDLGNVFTVELWVNYAGGAVPDDFERMVTRKGEFNTNDGWEISLESNRDKDLTVRGSSAASPNEIRNLVSSWAEGGWHHIVVVYSGGDALAYADGAYGDDCLIAPVRDNDRPLFIGRYGESEIRMWVGLMDEIRISAGLRDAAWIKASYESGRDHLIFYGDEELY